MKRCKHKGERLLCYLRPSKASRERRLSPMHPEYEEERVLKCNVCASCGEWLSLGPANDADERVQVEIAAAFAQGGFARFAHVAHHDIEECDHNYNYEFRYDCDGCHAEYLAGVIAAHKGEQ